MVKDPMRVPHLSKEQKGRARKEFFVLAFLWLPLVFTIPAGAASAPLFTYSGDPGFVATSPGEMASAKASWETPEYGFYTGHNPATAGSAVNAPWQLSAVNASTAYALGYFGQGVTLGMMDSGYRATHEAFQTDLIKPVTAEGVYGTSGYGYRGAIPSNPFYAGDRFTVAGDQALTSDYSHGTGMLGVTSGIRDGKNQHGIAFGSMMYVAKTGGSDGQSHGPFHDYAYWYTANKALVDAGAQVINSSWGSYVQTLDRARYDGYGNDLGADGNLANAYELVGRDSASSTAMAIILPSQNLKDLEYQYFFFKKSYSEGGIQYDKNHPGLSFMDAIWDAIKDSGTVNVRSAGNNDWDNPYYRPAYPLFNPWAENQWIAVGGVIPPTDANPEYTKQSRFNEAGLAKWWTVSTPSNSIWTSGSGSDTTYSGSSGTSPATPVATAVMGVLLSRYPNMNAMQVRELMFTTANNKMSDGVRFLGTGQTSATGESIAWTAPDGLPDQRWGWGIPDLAKGMYGPGQFLSPMVYTMNKASLDVWSNNISQTAIKEREREDLAWLAGYKAQGIAYAGDYGPNVLNPDGTLNEQAFMTQGILNDPYIQAITNGHPEMYDKIAYEDAVKWRKEWMDGKAAYIEHKITNGLYTASLTKQGPGMLVMTGNNTYEGGTMVEAGTLYGFTESFGTAPVNINGGYFGVLSHYNDLFTMKGLLTTTQSHLANINVNSGGTYVIVTGNDVNVGTLTFNKGSKLTIAAADTDILRDVFNNHSLVATGTVSATTLAGSEYMVVDPDYAFFNMDVLTTRHASGPSTITGTLSWNDADLASYAANSNGRTVANVISTHVPNRFMDQLLWSTKDQVHSTLDSLGNDMYLNVDNTSMVNSLTLSRTLENQVSGFGHDKNIQISDTARVWASGVGSWSDVDFGRSDLDGEFYAALVGMEADITSNNKAGLFFGAGESKFRGGQYGTVDSNDLHVGVYGVSDIPEMAKFTYGTMYTNQDRESSRKLTVIDQSQINNVATTTDITQVFADAAYTGFNKDKYSIEPYLGMNMLWLKSDGFDESVGDYKFHTDANSQTLGAATLGVRGSAPLLTVGTVKLTARGYISGTTFMGDTTPEAYLQILDLGKARIEGGKMDNPMLNLGTGLDATLSESVKLSLSYVGSFNSDIQSNGVAGNLRIAF